MLAKALDTLAGRIERAEVLDPVAEKVAGAAQKLLNRRGLTDLLSGTPAGHSLHPLFIALPIGSWTSAGVFDVLGDTSGAQTLTGIGLLTAIPSVVTGASDWCYTDGAERRVGLVHATCNYLAIGAYLGSWLARRSGRRGLGIGLSVIGGGAISAGGWLGGHLSYALGVGVDTTAFQHSEEDWTAVIAADQVFTGEATGADLAGVPVVLTRTPEGDVVVLADRCTHRGGPLHEGEMRHGCLTCPWHDSEFALDGTVVRGPATRPQPAYEVKVIDGQVLARRADDPRSLRTNPVGL